MNWNLLVTKSARKELARLPSRDQQRIAAALDEIATKPFSGDIKRLQPDGWRRRVGNYRIFYDLYVDELRILSNAAPQVRTDPDG
jgi:mRNA-degrading endonuclease RelE of RelBE toxin-antitoxin system